MENQLQIQKKPEVSAAKLARARRLGSYTRKWILGLSILIIPNMIANVFTTNTYLSEIALFNTIGSVIGYACLIVEIIFFIKLREDEEEYFRCIVFAIGSLVAYGAVDVLSRADGSGIYMVMLLMECVAVALYCIRSYYECNAHAALMYSIDKGIAQKWFGLWKWQVIGNVGILIGSLLLVYQRLDRVLLTVKIGIVLILVMSVLSGIIGIIRILYLEKSARLMRDYEKKITS